jgi:hypothetical protein
MVSKQGLYKEGEGDVRRHHVAGLRINAYVKNQGGFCTHVQALAWN